MKKLILAAAMAIAAGSTHAMAVNGNVDATFSTVNGDVILTLVNKTPVTPASVTEIDLVIPQKGQKDGKHVALFTGNTVITEHTQVNLGSAQRVVALLAPAATPNQIASLSPSVSDDQDAGCNQCKQESHGIPIALKFQIAGATVNALRSTYVHLSQPFTPQTFVLPGPNS
jgi:hypothetical protein